ncbi:hypothetical protein [Sphingomonas pokkalii]|nr:hypothetical protein [Sphingomonas pokkalii]
MDLDLIAAPADTRPDWTIVMVGPVVKIDPAELPRYAAGWVRLDGAEDQEAGRVAVNRTGATARARAYGEADLCAGPLPRLWRRHAGCSLPEPWPPAKPLLRWAAGAPM